MNIEQGSAPGSVAENAADATAETPITVEIYVAQHCGNCAYAYELADEIRQNFPSVQLRLIDIQTTTEPIPQAVFATPTYLLNGRVWSLGNPSPAQVHETLTALCPKGSLTQIL